MIHLLALRARKWEPGCQPPLAGAIHPGAMGKHPGENIPENIPGPCTSGPSLPGACGSSIRLRRRSVGVLLSVSRAVTLADKSGRKCCYPLRRGPASLVVSTTQFQDLQHGDFQKSASKTRQKNSRTEGFRHFLATPANRKRHDIDSEKSVFCDPNPVGCFSAFGNQSRGHPVMRKKATDSQYRPPNIVCWNYLFFVCQPSSQRLRCLPN